MNIFLDIDGVLCPPSMTARDGGAYCHFTRFETIMRDFQKWKIVISSGLRERFDLNQLRSKFSDDIAARIVGVTPVIGMSISQCRQHEIERYLLNTNQALLPWIALDDIATQFANGLSNLVLCDMATGLDDCIEMELRAKLTAYELAFPQHVAMTPIPGTVYSDSWNG
ncbi:MAG: HAD domain-containing protein [Gallionella sp.]|nr:HAD domain-containing protein [Gallionella sp.]